MTDQYLILHKVRGQPSFDCAEQMEVNGETWWVTNSGHRAYPYQTWNLVDMVDEWNIPIDDMPEDWPDHYAVNNLQPKPPTLKPTPHTPTLDDLD